MSLDHGVLNVPLAKRGNIDVQIDAYKREQAAKERTERAAKSAQNKIDKGNAKILFARLIAHPEIIADRALRMGVKPGRLKETLASMAIWEPKKFIVIAHDLLKG